MRVSRREAASAAALSVATVLAYLDSFALHPEMAHLARDLGAKLFEVGFIVAAYSVTAAPLQVILGYLMDRVGRRKPFAILGMVGDSAVLLAYPAAGSPGGLAAVRLLHGVTSSLAGPSIMSMAAWSPHPLAGLGARMGLYGLSMTLSAVVGWLLGGSLFQLLGTSRAFAVLSAIMLSGAAVSALVDDSGPLDHGVAAGGPSAGDLIRRIRAALGAGAFGYASIFSVSFSEGALVTLLPLAAAGFGAGQLALGIFLAATGILSLAFQLPLGRLSDRIGRRLSLSISLTGVTIGVVAASRATNFLELAASSIFFGVGYALLFPSAAALAAEESGPGESSLASGLFHASDTAGVILGSITSALAAGLLGIRSALAASSLLAAASAAWGVLHARS